MDNRQLITHFPVGQIHLQPNTYPLATQLYTHFPIGQDALQGNE